MRTVISTLVVKKILLFIFCLLFFIFFIFIGKNYFFGGLEDEINKQIEDKYIEPTSLSKEENIYAVNNNIKQGNIETSLKSAYNIDFIYIPRGFKNDVPDYITSLKTFLNSEVFSQKIDNLRVELYKKKDQVRGKMKNGSIKMYGVTAIKLSEFTSVSLHEFAHFIDLYYLKKSLFTDLSDNFYNISWDFTKIIKPGLSGDDFVSGYAMINKYEDFAESFTYFVLHNKDFIIKAKKSDALKKKFLFFYRYLFKGKEFILTDFSKGNKIEDYYRDITKIDFSLENFLQFVKK